MKFSILSILAIVLLATSAFADSNKDCQVISETINPTEAQGTDDYVNLTDGSFGTTAAAEDEFIVPSRITAWSIAADVDVAPGANDEWTVTVMDDGAATAVTCSITDTNTSCFGAGESLIAGGSDLTVLIDSGNGAGAPAAAGELRFGFCLGNNR